MKNQTTIRANNEKLLHQQWHFNPTFFNINEDLPEEHLKSKISKWILCLAILFAISIEFSFAAPIAITAVKRNLKCNGKSNGAINITVTGGNKPYTFVWCNGATTEDVSGLMAGTYTVTVTDNYGFTKTKSWTLTQPSALVVYTYIESNGVDATAVVNGGTGPGTYTYTWNCNPNQFTPTATSLPLNKTWIVTVKDANNCLAVGSIAMRISNVPVLMNAININIFPNPTHGVVNIGFDKTEKFNYTVTLYNVLGRETFKQTLINEAISSTAPFDFSGFNKGVYLIKVETPMGDVMKKLILD